MMMMTRDDEAHLEKYILTSSKMFHGLGYKSVRILAYEYGTRLGRNVPDSWNRRKYVEKMGCQCS